MSRVRHIIAVLGLLPPLGLPGLPSLPVALPTNVTGVIATLPDGTTFAESACRLGAATGVDPASIKLPVTSVTTLRLLVGGEDCGPVTTFEVPLPGALAAKACKGAGSRPNDRNTRKVVKATLCGLNRIRRANGLPAFRLSKRLSRAARAHNADMVRRAYYAHEAPDGPGLADRLARAHWSGPTAGENLGLGGLSLSTSASMLKAWMDSPPHKANILYPKFKAIGIAVAPSNPVGGGKPVGLYTIDFGSNR